MNWKLLICSILLTGVFFLTLMFYLGFDLDTFKKVVLIQSLLVAAAIIFDSMERKDNPIFSGYIIYPLLGILFVLGVTPILDFFAERPKGFHSWDIRNMFVINSSGADYHFRKLAWYGKAYIQLGFAMVGGFLGLFFHLIFRNN
ncbi:hypothetical protein [Acinetobacter calcoaceticus]|uniref:hypothetical protein n=1 Tax=Acinetobacter calcoaceticus TaxID=471 RepID=UPI0002D07096|nr:hypothetical protein [Acinetobacter calcoaceticus]ENU09606.1 hypothetical protein F997_03055 [Acinetobacter calcoaceticus NIPH 13]